MPRKSDADQRQPQAAADLHVNHGQGDGDAGLGFQDLVEEAVARVVVFTCVPAQPFLEEQAGIQTLERVVVGRRWGEFCADRVGELVQPFQIMRNVEVRLFFLGDQ